MSLANKVVVITGGSSGIGADAAKAFLQAGARVVINGRSEKKLTNLTAELGSFSHNLTYLAGDITNPSVSSDLISLAITQFGGVDILINNAGIFEPKPFLDHTGTDIDAYLNLLKSYFVTTQYAIKSMLERGSGAIVNIGSMWANHAIGATPCSGASTAKGGVHSLTKSLAIEFAPNKIGKLHCTCGGGDALV